MAMGRIPKRCDASQLLKTQSCQIGRQPHRIVAIKAPLATDLVLLFMYLFYVPIEYRARAQRVITRVKLAMDISEFSLDHLIANQRQAVRFYTSYAIALLV